MGVNYFIFNGESSLDHGAYIGGQETFNAPQRDVTKVKIPGRNGDLIRDNGRWLNCEVPYTMVVMDEFRQHTDEIRAWLFQPVGYARLEDTYHPDVFRLARVQGDIEFETAAYNLTGKTRVVFDCKPQRFLKSGEPLQGITSGAEIFNPTRFYSKPLIRVTVTGSGVLTVGTDTITLTGITGTHVDIDSEVQDCYEGATSLNSKVTLTKFPELAPGKTAISWTGDISAVEVAGRWYTI